MGTLNLQSNGPLYSNTVIGTLPFNGWAWAVTFGTASMGLGGAPDYPGPPCPPVSRRSQVRPRNTTADGPSLATSAWACEVQAVCAHAPLPYWSGAAIFDRASSACRQYCSSSPALGVICWSCRAFNSPFNHRWPCVRCCRSTSVEQPAICHSNIYIIIRHV